MSCLACPRWLKIKNDLADKLLETHRLGERWAARQRYNSNKTQRLHDELKHVDIEPLEDTCLGKWAEGSAQLYEMEPARPSAENLPRFYKPQKYFGGILS